MNLINVLKGLWLTARDILPVSLFLIIFQIFVLKTPITNFKSLGVGIAMSTLGLYLFVQGLKNGLIPLGTTVGSNLVALDNKLLIILFAFILGYTSTLAEPALSSLAMEVEELSIGAMKNRWLVHSVALGVAGGMALGVFKIMNKIPSTYILIPVVIVVGILGFFAPENITGIAFDSGAVTTGPVTVPLNMALAIGLSAAIGGSDPLIDGFGIVALAALGPMVAVLLLGMIIKF